MAGAEDEGTNFYLGFGDMVRPPAPAASSSRTASRCTPRGRHDALPVGERRVATKGRWRRSGRPGSGLDRVRPARAAAPPRLHLAPAPRDPSSSGSRSTSSRRATRSTTRPTPTRTSSSGSTRRARHDPSPSAGGRPPGARRRHGRRARRRGVRQAGRRGRGGADARAARGGPTSSSPVCASLTRRVGARRAGGHARDLPSAHGARDRRVPAHARVGGAVRARTRSRASVRAWWNGWTATT